MDIYIYIFLGFLAELIDGTMGMAYGVSCNTFLRSAGISSTVSSACIHVSEIFTTFVSGLSHLKLRNIHKALFTKLLIPGIIGGVIGAYILVTAENSVIDIIIDIYLIIMGIVIINKLFKKQKIKEYGNYTYALGFVGGLTDAMGGGGWGPIVTSTLLAAGHDIRKTIGTVNSAEFFVTIAETTAFMVMIKDFNSYKTIIMGLIIGGVIAAPLGAYLCNKIPAKLMLGIVGTLVIVLNMYKFFQHINIL